MSVYDYGWVNHKPEYERGGQVVEEKQLLIILVVLVATVFSGCKNDKKEEDRLVISDNSITSTDSNSTKDANVSGDVSGKVPLNQKEIDDFLYEDRELPLVPEIDLTDQYSVKVFNVDEKCLSCASGIVCRDEDILITDQDNNCIKVFNYQGELVNEIGQSGNGELEFVKPAGITEDNGLIYVIDGGNKRITILNEDLTYNSSIPYSGNLSRNIDKYDTFDSIIIQNDNIYLSAHKSMIFEIWCIPLQGEQFKLDTPPFLGSLYYSNECIYALDAMEVKLEVGARTGKNNLHIIKDNKVTETIEMPYSMGARTFFMNGDEMYAVCSPTGSVEQLDLNGNYTGTIGRFPRDDKGIYGVDMDNNGAFYVLNGTSSIYKIEKKK